MVHFLCLLRLSRLHSGRLPETGCASAAAASSCIGTGMTALEQACVGHTQWRCCACGQFMFRADRRWDLHLVQGHWQLWPTDALLRCQHRLQRPSPSHLRSYLLNERVACCCFAAAAATLAMPGTKSGHYFVSPAAIAVREVGWLVLCGDIPRRCPLAEVGAALSCLSISWYLS